MDNDKKPAVDEVIDETKTENEPPVHDTEPEVIIDETAPEEPVEETPTAPSAEPAKEVTKKKSFLSRFSKSQKIGIGILVVAIIAAVVGIVVLGGKKDTPASVSNSKKDTATADTVKTKPSSDDITVNGNTYYAKPTEIKDLILFNQDECTGTEGCTNGRNNFTKSFLVGKTKDGKDIIAYRASGGIDAADIIVIKNGSEYEVAFPANFAKDYSYFEAKPNIKTSSSTSLSELTADPTITIKEQPLKTSGVLTFAFLRYKEGTNILEVQSPEKGTKLITKNNIDYYVGEKDKGAYSIKSVNAYFGDLFSYNYSLDGELSKSGSKAAETIKWSKGDQSTSTYYTGGQGCGTGASFVAGKVSKSDLSEVGKTPGGQTVYQLANNQPIVTELFEKDYAKENALDDYKNLSLQQFVDKHSYFLIENGLGDFMVYISDKAAPKGGCAKPVVYLYPQKATNVSVSVGANVTISDPLYPTGGWTNVLAQPNGALTYQGKSFGSLFWEGQGNGAYPDITSGTVVARSKAIATITEQLKQQGLQGREITEFISFWKPNLPNTPFVRLSWLSTRQLNELAPLTVLPKPDTTIRVFLDFEGLQKPVNMPAQTLKTPKRNGFTVVEWGGLARNGLNRLVR
ncbi:MAG: hypothetical protein NTX11_02290 [Candidatus Saccharibacteria bacterium]|nr:hypothetical protein [Candidatus Saccharibacteria bacterium]